MRKASQIMDGTPILLALVFLGSTQSLAVNPCEEGNHYILHNAAWRGTGCARTVSESICDRYIFNKVWYKVIGHDDSEPRRLAEGPADMYFCGTDYPIYLLNESHPVTDGLIATRNACMRDGSNLCRRQYEVQILKCGSFYLYNLSRTDTCDIAYCFGENMPCSKPDPCDAGNQVVLEVDEDRSTTCKKEDLQLCDSDLKNVWYRPVMNNRNIQMATNCVEQNRCGTVSPIWLNGKEPLVADKTVDMKACVNIASTSDTCTCGKKIDIQVRNCSSYSVYNLTATSSCPERYCFGSVGDCSKTEGAATNKSLSDEPFKIIFICLAVAVVLVLLTSLTCLMFKKYKFKMKIVSESEIKPTIKRGI